MAEMIVEYWQYIDESFKLNWQLESILLGHNFAASLVTFFTIIRKLQILQPIWITCTGHHGTSVYS